MLYEMPGIDTSFIRHELNVMPEAQPVKQQGSRSAVEHVDAVIEEVGKLRETNAVTKILYLRWTKVVGCS